MNDRENNNEGISDVQICQSIIKPTNINYLLIINFKFISFL